jgi:hypothetical protein
LASSTLRKERKVTSKPLIEIDFAELPDGTLLDTIEDPTDPAKTQLAIYRGNKIHYVDQFESDKRIYLPISRGTEILKEIRFSRGAKSYGSTAHLFTVLCAIFSHCLDMPDLQRALLASFVISTWFPEKLPIAPYVAFVGLPRSGKTTALRILGLLCRRSLLTSDITSASFYEVCNRLTPTIVIDETATAGDRRALFHLLRAGSTKGFVAIRKNKTFNGYCPKVVCWTQLPSDAPLNSRCIIVPLQESDRRDLLRVTDPMIQALAGTARQMLQQYRLENFNRLSLAPVPGDERLNSRARDLYESLALTIDDANIREILALQFQEQQDLNREPLSPVQAAVLQALDWYIHEHPNCETCAISALTQAVALQLNHNGERFHTSPHQVGHILTSFGLTERKRTNTGWILLLTRQARKLIHTLPHRNAVQLDLSLNRDGCVLCTNPENQPVASESRTGPREEPVSDGVVYDDGEHRELGALKTG